VTSCLAGFIKTFELRSNMDADLHSARPKGERMSYDRRGSVELHFDSQYISARDPFNKKPM
jgi:hypothetical protein